MGSTVYDNNTRKFDFLSNKEEYYKYLTDNRFYGYINALQELTKKNNQEFIVIMSPNAIKSGMYSVLDSKVEKILKKLNIKTYDMTDM
jgi:hypothetical protein